MHTLNHADAPQFIKERGANVYLIEQIDPQLFPVKKVGIELYNFAFPNNRKDEQSISLLKTYFKRFRAGTGAKLTEPNSEAYEKGFFPVSELKDKVIFGGFGVGEYYKTQKTDIFRALKKASKKNKALVIFSHAIAPNAKHINIPLELLNASLEKAHSLGIKIVGFDDLENLNCK